MTRLQTCLTGLRAAGKKALIPYVTAGDPGKEVTVPLMHAMVEAGAAVIELGVPFSDPMADGPVIQRAAERALVHGTSLRDVLAMVGEFRQKNQSTPVILMGYLNPVEVMGYERFAREAAAAGVDGVLTVDMPPEEAGDLAAQLERQGIAPVFLVAPTSPPARVQAICAHARGFVYYVSMKGVTGASHLDFAAVAQKISIIRQHTDLPVGIGFGIKDADSAAQAAACADAVVVGSAVVQRVEDNRDDTGRILAAVSAFLRTLVPALQRAAG